MQENAYHIENPEMGEGVPIRESKLDIDRHKSSGRILDGIQRFAIGAVHSTDQTNTRRDKREMVKENIWGSAQTKKKLPKIYNDQKMTDKA